MRRRSRAWLCMGLAAISPSKDISTMFTGITEHTAKIESLERSDNGGRLRVSLAGASAKSPLR